ncbi:hypothetical protein OF001_U100057 [Pseudomonas sp. OF001]|nr:hypothetical protein OF001_U100057 [Pseudomonas sp. OF001]
MGDRLPARSAVHRRCQPVAERPRPAAAAGRRRGAVPGPGPAPRRLRAARRRGVGRAMAQPGLTGACVVRAAHPAVEPPAVGCAMRTTSS